MNLHESIRELLPLAAAGALEPAEERRVREHVRECPACAADLETLLALGDGLRHLPSVAPSAELLARTQALVTAEMTSRAEGRMADILMGVTALLGWTVTFTAWVAWRLITSGGPALMNSNWINVAVWLGGSTVFAWMTAGAAVLMLGRHGRLGRSVS
jgi:hypothetical protein